MAKTPTDVFGKTDPSKALGRDPRSGVEKKIGEQALKLDFNVDKERAVRQSEIDRQAQTSLEKLGRGFALTSGGTKQGRALSRASSVEGARIGASAQLESELSTRKTGEARANIETLTKVQAASEARGTTAAQLGQAERQLDITEAASSANTKIAKRAQDLNEKVQNAEITRADANQELNDYIQKEGLEQGARQLDITEAASSANTEIAKRAQDLEEKVRNGEMTRADANQELNDFVQRKQLTISEREVAVRETLAEQAGDQLGLSKEQFLEMTRQFDIVDEKDRNQFFATLEEDARQKDGQLAAQREDLAERARQGDQGAANDLKQIDEQIRNNKAILGLDRDKFFLGHEEFKKNLKLEQEKLQETREQREANTGYQNKQLQQQQEQFDTTSKNQVDQFKDTHDLDDEQFREVLRRTLEDEAFRGTESGKQALQFMLTFKQRKAEHIDNQSNAVRALAQEDERNLEITRQYDETLDNRMMEVAQQHGLSKDQLEEAKEQRRTGKAIADDKIDFALNQLERIQTDAMKQFDEDLLFKKAEADRAEVFNRAGLTGVIGSEATMAKISQTHSQMITEAQIFSETPPTLLAWKDIIAMASAVEKDGSIPSSSPAYNAAFDLDGDGNINAAENDNVRDSVTLLESGVYSFQTPGRATFTRQTLGLEDRKWREGLSLSRDQFKQNGDQWKSTFEGRRIETDEDGNAILQQTWNAQEGKWQDATSIDREQFTTELQQIERRTNSSAADMAARIGVVPEDNGLAIADFYAEVGKDGVIGGKHFASIMGFGGDKSGNSAEFQTEFSNYARKALGDPAEGESWSEEDINNKKADIARQFLLTALPDEQKAALNETVARAVFGADFSPRPGAPSAFAQVAGTALGIGASFLGCDVNIKEEVEAVDHNKTLLLLEALKVNTWNYKSPFSNARHMGPMAQDFKRLFQLGEKDTEINTVDAFGVALSAIKGLKEEVDALKLKLEEKL